MSEEQKPPQKDSEHSESEKPKISAPLKLILDGIKEWVAAINWLAIAFGVFILAIYCWTNHIVPDGISVGDILFLVFAFAVSLLWSVAIGVYSSFWLVWIFVACLRCRGKNVRFKKGWSDAWLPAIFSGIVFLVMVLFCVILPVAIRWLFGFFIGVGFLLLILGVVEFLGETGWDGNDIPSAEGRSIGALGRSRADGSGKKRYLSPRAGLVLLILFVLLGASLLPPFQNIVMSSIGIQYSSGQMIMISEDDYKRLMDQAAASGIDVPFCQMPRSEQFATTSAEVVWHGIGTTSYVRLLDRVLKEKKSILVQLPRNGLTVTKPSAGVRLPDKAIFCYDNAPTGKTPSPH